MNREFNLLNDLGIGKPEIRKAYISDAYELSKEEHSSQGFDRVKELLDHEGYVYNIEDAKTLVSKYISKREQYIVDNRYYFSKLKFWSANRKYKKMMRALHLINYFEAL
jgi:hypothetical protein